MEIKGIDPIEIAGLTASGNINPLEAYVILKELESKTKLALEQIKDSALTEAGKYPEKSFKAYGASIEVRNGASTYKFCSAISELENRLKQLKEQSKLGEFADTDSGQIIERAIKQEGKTTLAISFAS